MFNKKYSKELFDTIFKKSDNRVLTIKEFETYSKNVSMTKILNQNYRLELTLTKLDNVHKVEKLFEIIVENIKIRYIKQEKIKTQITKILDTFKDNFNKIPKSNIIDYYCVVIGFKLMFNEVIVKGGVNKHFMSNSIFFFTNRNMLENNFYKRYKDALFKCNINDKIEIIIKYFQKSQINNTRLKIINSINSLNNEADLSNKEEYMKIAMDNIIKTYLNSTKSITDDNLKMGGNNLNKDYIRNVYDFLFIGSEKNALKLSEFDGYLTNIENTSIINSNFRLEITFKNPTELKPLSACFDAIFYSLDFFYIKESSLKIKAYTIIHEFINQFKRIQNNDVLTNYAAVISFKLLFEELIVKGGMNTHFIPPNAARFFTHDDSLYTEFFQGYLMAILTMTNFEKLKIITTYFNSTYNINRTRKDLLEKISILLDTIRDFNDDEDIINNLLIKLVNSQKTFLLSNINYFFKESQSHIDIYLCIFVIGIIFLTILYKVLSGNKILIQLLIINRKNKLYFTIIR